MAKYLQKWADPATYNSIIGHFQICLVTARRAPIESKLYPQPRIIVTKSIKQPSALCAHCFPRNK